MNDTVQENHDKLVTLTKELTWLELQLAKRTAEDEAEDRDAFLRSIVHEGLTPGEVDEMARLDELKHRYNRTPWEI